VSPERSMWALGAILGAAFSLASLGCGSSDKSEAAPGGTPTATPTTTTTTPPTTTESRKARVRFKGLTRLQSDLSLAFALPPAELCTELGTAPCVEVHRIALGGVMPYTRGIHEPLPLRSVSNAAAVDRLVLSACDRRAELDFAGATPAVLFGDLTDGALADASVEKAARKLYNALLQRDETAEERAALVAFAGEQRAKGTTARDVAALSCYAIGTSVEALFY
jgi:hypothetical protein